MAKKNEVALTNAGNLMAEHGAALKQLGITPHSFNTMAVVKRTNQLKKELELLETELEGTNKKLEANASKIDKAIDEAAADYQDKMSKPFTQFAKQVKLVAPKVNVSGSVANLKGGRKLVLRVNFMVNVNRASDNCHGNIGTSVNKTLTKQLKDLHKEQDDLFNQSSKVRAEIQDVRCALQDIGDLERSANAQTTHRMLSQTPEGKALLDSLGLGDLD